MAEKKVLHRLIIVLSVYPNVINFIHLVWFILDEIDNLVYVPM